MSNKQEARQLAMDALRKPPSDELFYAPLDYIFAEHFRQRVLCGVLDEFVSGQAYDHEMMIVALKFLKQDFKFHIQDEEVDLFPKLRARAEPDDDIDLVLDQLSQEHMSDHIDATHIIKILEQAIDKRSNHELPTTFTDTMHRFTANERRHLIVENAIVVPLARARLTESDLEDMCQNMAKRRGVKLIRNKNDQRTT